MARILTAGVSVADRFAHTVILGSDHRELEVFMLDERKQEGNDPLWFLESLTTLDRKLADKIENAGIGIELSSILFYEFPMDSLLSKVEQNDQVDWELALNFPDYKKDRFINEMRILRTNAKDHVMDVLVTSLRRDFIHAVYSRLAASRLTLHTLDLNQFSAEAVLLRGYPEIKLRVAGLLSIEQSSAMVSVLRNGKLYRCSMVSNPSVSNVTETIMSAAENLPLTFLFLHGSAVTPEWTKGLRESFGSMVTTLNPFRSMQDRSSQKRIGLFVGKEFRFASAVGSALRTT